MHVLFVVFLLGHVTQATYDPSVCNTDSFIEKALANPGPSKPVLASRYSVRVEANLMEVNRTVDATEFYDWPGKRGAVHQWEGGIQTNIYLNYAINEVITVIYPDRTDPIRQQIRCDVQELRTFNSSFGLGFHVYFNSTRNTYNIGNTLRLEANTPDLYLGRVETSAGVLAEAWRSCVYDSPTDATFNATWYFTANSTWVSSMGFDVQSPLMLHVVGRVGSPHAQDFEHEYIFMEYRPDFLDTGDVLTAFETPTGVVCQRANLKALPNVTDNFSFTSEIVDTATQYINFMAEYYYYALRVVRYEFQSPTGSVYGSNPLVRVHDFNTGVAYIMDTVIGNCTATPISNLGFDAHSLDSAHVRMKTSEEFFDLNTKYTYTGQRTVRDIECDVWIAVIDDWPPGRPFETHWEWYFATNSWMESVGYLFEVQIPVQLRITAQNFDPPFERIYNIYNYKEEENNPLDFSISPCFDPQHRREYTITLPGNYTKWVTPNRDNFVYFFVLAVTSFAQISPLRVANVQLDSDDVNIYVTFSMLDQAPLSGDVIGVYPEYSLGQAANNLEMAITAHSFYIELQLQDNMPLQRLVASTFTVGVPPTLQPAPRQRRDAVQHLVPDTSLEMDTKTQDQVSDSSTMYSSGAMAGLGVAMVTVGYGLGFILMMYTYRRFFVLRTSESFGNVLIERSVDKP